MRNSPVVYMSNLLEQLAEALGENLFRKDANPLTPRLVIIPHPSLKRYLNLFFASNPQLNICAGLDFKVLLAGIQSLISKKKNTISQMTLSFQIERVLRSVLQNPEEELFLELRQYLGRAKEQKIIWIAQELSRVFYEYVVLEPHLEKEFLSRSGWKQEVWKRVFISGQNLFPVLWDQKTKPCDVHVFGFASLPSHFYDFFCSLDARFYFLSPSEMFWEDLCSDKERIYLEKKMVGKKVRLQVQEQMQFLLKKTHPLLANWGKVGRSMLSRFGESESQLLERYVCMDSCSALSVLQRSLFVLEDEPQKKEFNEKDTSLLVVSAPSPLREVEVLVQTLSELMVKEKCEPKDVVVLSADLDVYLPYIHTVFKEQSPFFSYSIEGLSAAIFSEPMQAIDCFFSLLESRFDVDLVLQFLSFPSLSKKWDFSEKDLALLKKWALQTNVLWGLSLEHKQSCLQKVGSDGTVTLCKRGTWKEAFAKLLSSLACKEEGSPIQISITEAPLLGRFIHFIESLEEDARPIYEKKEFSFEKWSLWAKTCFFRYLENSQEVQELLLELSLLQKELSQEDFLMSFTSFKRSIDSYLQKKKTSLGLVQLQAVRFLPLEIGGSFPAKILYVLGCDEESFPKKQIFSCLDELASFRKMPSLSEQSRYLFLELILHARCSLVFSYQCISKEDQKKLGPSKLIQELMDYLDVCGFFSNSERSPSNVFTRHHPALCFAKSYFLPDSCLKNPLPSSFRLAQSFYVKEKKENASFFIPYSDKLSRPLVNFDRIEIKKIQDFAKNPSSFYLKESKGIFFDFIEPSGKEFFLAPLTKKKMKLAALKSSLDQGVYQARRSGFLPLGGLEEFAQRELEKDLEDWKKNLTSWGLCEEDLFTLHLTDSVRDVHRQKGKILCPLLHVEVEGGGRIGIQGDLFPVSSKGLLWINKTNKEDLFTFWPTWLIFLCLADRYGWEKKCYFSGGGTMDGKEFSISVKDPFYFLSQYIRLYMRALQEPLFVYPNWIEPLITQKLDVLEKKMVFSSFDMDFMSPYDQWIERRGHNFTAELLQKNWNQMLASVFSPLIEELFVEDSKDADV